MGMRSDKRCRHTVSRRGQGEEDDREVRRTGDRDHCAADSATYGRDCCLVSAGKVSGRTPPRAGQSRTPCAVC